MATPKPALPEQAAAIAVRHHGNTFEVCLIRKKESNNWGIPKGFVDPGDTHEQTAMNEAWEEAGLEGRLLGEPIGRYEYQKWSGTFVVAVYVMNVLEEHAEWEEMRIRERRWSSFDEAAVLLEHHPVRPLLDEARQLAEDHLGGRPLDAPVRPHDHPGRGFRK